MKLLRASLLLMAVLTAACAHLPEIRPAGTPEARRQAAECSAIFPRGEWQYTHAIELFPPAGTRQTVLGIIQLSSENRTFHCVMLTIEGLVLLEADYDGHTEIQRAIPPLDRPGVAEGMVRDILLIFFTPEQPCLAAGYSRDGDRICRYPDDDQGHEDIVLKTDGVWQIRHYDASHKLLRTVSPMTQADIRPDSPPSRVELVAHGLAGYRLRMRLVEAIPLDPQIILKQK